MRLLLFALLCLITVSLVRFVRALGKKTSRPKTRPESQNRPAASPDEIVDVHYEECDGVSDDKEVSS